MIDLQRPVVSVNSGSMNRSSSIWRQWIVSAFLCISAASLPAWAERGNVSVAVKGQTVDELIAAYMQANKVPGLSVAVAQTPYITRITGYGFSDSERKLLVSTNTLFALGRLSEAFTAVAVLQLVDQGKVKLGWAQACPIMDLYLQRFAEG